MIDEPGGKQSGIFIVSIYDSAYDCPTIRRSTCYGPSFIRISNTAGKPKAKRMKPEIKCGKCGDDCMVDGEYPKFFAWCETCNDYADYDMHEYAADYMGSLIDGAEHRMDLG